MLRPAAASRTEEAEGGEHERFEFEADYGSVGARGPSRPQPLTKTDRNLRLFKD